MGPLDYYMGSAEAGNGDPRGEPTSGVLSDVANPVPERGDWETQGNHALNTW